MVTKEMLVQYEELNRKKKEIENQLDELKKVFNAFFDISVGQNKKGEVEVDEYKLQRQIRTTERFETEPTLQRLEELRMMDLIVKKPDDEKIRSAIKLGLINEKDFDGCVRISSTKAFYVRKLAEKTK